MKALIYARKSISDRDGSDESDSIAEQFQSGEHYAAAHGWTIVGKYSDDGVSATLAPEDRPGWREAMASGEFDRVIVRHIDRMSRNLRHFLETNDDLDKRGAALVAVHQNLDMASATGRMTAQVLAVFAEYEREVIRERVASTRRRNIREGRVVGGTVPYGWRSVPNPSGKGLVLAQDPERVPWVRLAAERTLAGHSLYSTMQTLNEQGAPLPTANQKQRTREGWGYTTLERLLRHPIVAGMTPYNPGNDSKRRGDDVLRGEDGLPVVDESVAVLSTADWRRMVKLLDERPTAQALPRAMKAKTSGLLSGLVVCGDERHGDDHPRRWRGTVQGRPGYLCPSCHHAITNFEDIVVEHFLQVVGPQVRWTMIEEVHEGGAALLPEVEHRLAELRDLLDETDDDDEIDRLQEQQAALLRERRQRRAESPTVSYVAEPAGAFAESWAAAEGVEAQRAVLSDALDRLVVRRGRPGRRTAAQVLGRLDFQWAEGLHA